jgi:hypothetical protein
LNPGFRHSPLRGNDGQVQIANPVSNPDIMLHYHVLSEPNTSVRNPGPLDSPSGTGDDAMN